LSATTSASAGVYQRRSDGGNDFIEEFNAQGQYKTPAGWLDRGTAETIHVKGKPDVTLDVVTTRHGRS